MPKMDFDVWMEKVNKKIADKLGGLTSDDLPDCCYYDMYEDGASPAMAAKEAIENAGGF